MDRNEEAFALIPEICEKEPWNLIGAKVDPGWDWLRDDPRFQDILRCARLAP